MLKVPQIVKVADPIPPEGEDSLLGLSPIENLKYLNNIVLTLQLKKIVVLVSKKLLILILRWKFTFKHNLKSMR